MANRLLYISECLNAPFDEGFKKIVYMLFSKSAGNDNILLVTKQQNDTGKLKVSAVRLNKLFINYGLVFVIRQFSPVVILYIPEASCSFYSFIRAKMLKIMGRKCRVVMLGAQQRNYSSIHKFIINRFLRPDLILVLRQAGREFLKKMQCKVKTLPPAVDIVQFHPADSDEKKIIRAEYGLPLDKKIITHVGHLKTKRNIKCLVALQQIEDVQVVIVGSTATVTEYGIKEELARAGIRIIDSYISDISKIYQMSDIYVFPVINESSAIDMPLSVLEAMACNLPVVSTRFGALMDYFNETQGFRYFDTVDELISIVSDISNDGVKNRELVRQFTWDRFADEVISACESLA